MQQLRLDGIPFQYRKYFNTFMPFYFMHVYIFLYSFIDFSLCTILLIPINIRNIKIAILVYLFKY